MRQNVLVHGCKMFPKYVETRTTSTVSDETTQSPYLAPATDGIQPLSRQAASCGAAGFFWSCQKCGTKGLSVSCLLAGISVYFAKCSDPGAGGGGSGPAKIPRSSGVKYAVVLLGGQQKIHQCRARGCHPQDLDCA